ncbi:MAG: 4Fe-4S dicluster domain-containing protein [Dehalococcoidales bacterium]
MAGQGRDGDLPVWIIEPDTTGKRREVAAKLPREGRKVPGISETANIIEIKRRLRDIREYSRDNINSLVQELHTNLTKKYPGVRLKSTRDAAEAIKYINEVAGGTNTISVNNSSIVNQELKPGLISSGFTVINSYINEYDIKEKKVRDYWDLPHLLGKNLIPSFEVSKKVAGINRTPQDTTVKDYLAVLGVNAISADDGTVFFVQHFHNIYRDLKEAKKVFLIVGLDKIARSRQDAALVTECMGIFGMESLLLGMRTKANKIPATMEITPLGSDTDRELHIILLDNGRTKMTQGKFRDLFLCIGCSACNQYCPIRFSFDVDYNWTPRIYLNQFLLGTGKSVDVCLHCEACRYNCPIGIDLPYLMWQAKLDHIKKHGRSLKNILLGTPELLAKLGSIFGSLGNRLMGLSLIRIPMELITGIDRKANLPTFHSRTFRKWFRENG